MSEFVIIATFDSLTRAYIARNILQGADILCVLDNEHMAGLGRSYGPSLELHLRVISDEAAEATALLRHEGLIPPEEGPVSRSRAHCPHCRSGHIGTTTGTKLRVLLAMLAASPLTNASYRCKDCGHTWQW